MKKTIINLLIILLFSCKSKVTLLENEGTIIEINKSGNYITILWECHQKPYKNQPCFAESRHPIYKFSNYRIGQRVSLSY